MALKCALRIAFLFLATAVAEIPKGYIMKLEPTCGSTDSGDDAHVTIVTDLFLSAYAECAGEAKVLFNSTDGVNLHLPVSYPGGINPCVFKKRKGAKVYVLKVFISYGEKKEDVHQEEGEYTVTCTFDNKGSNSSSNINLDPALIAPPEDKNLEGSASASTIQLQLIDVLGNNLSGRHAWRSRKVQLKGFSSGDGSEVGVRPISCDAIGSSGARYAIIRAGCGDGVIFKQTEGFITEGLETKSPYFESFGIEEDQDMTFQCNFTTCVSNCDGSSCTNERRRRVSEQKPKDVRLAVSEIVNLGLGSVKEQISSRSDVLELEGEDGQPNETLHWTAIFGIGLLVMTALALSLTVCSSLRRSRGHNPQD